MGRFGRWVVVGVLGVGLAGGAASGLAGSGPVPPMDPPEPLPATVAEPAARPAGPPKPAAAVALVWTNPAEARVNRPAAYTLTVTNTGPEAVQQAVVQVRVPAGVTASDAKPPAKAVGGVLLWELGTMAAGESKPLAMSFASPTRGSLTADAWVTCTGSAATTVQVREPKLEAFIEAPETVELGQTFQVVYRAKNTGDAAIEGVELTRKPAHELTSGSFVSAPIGHGPSLRPGDEKTEDALEKAVTPGVHTYEMTATGADGLKAAATAKVRVLAPKLAVSVTGPAEVGVGKAGTYTVTVTNTGDLAAPGVTLDAQFGGGFTYRPLLDFGSPLHRDWSKACILVADLKAGESRTLSLEAAASGPGRHVHRVTVTDARWPGITGTAECRTVVKGVPGIRMEVIDSADPLKVGEETTYEVKVTNTGTEADRSLVLACDLPPGMTLVKADGPVSYLERIGVDFERTGTAKTLHTVTFDPVRELGPKTQAVFQVTVRATHAGAAKFAARLTSDHLTTAVVKEESTTVYGE